MSINNYLVPHPDGYFITAFHVYVSHGPSLIEDQTNDAIVIKVE